MDQIIKNAVVVLLKRLQDQGNKSAELSMSIQMLELDEVKYECETPTLYEVVLLPPTKPLDIYTKSCIVEILVKKCWYSIKEAYELVHREGGLIRSHVREKHAVEVVGDLRAAGARVEMRPEKSEFCTYEDSVVEDACEAPDERLYEIVLLLPTKPLDRDAKSRVAQVLVEKCWYTVEEAHTLAYRTDTGIIKRQMHKKHAIEVTEALKAAGANVEMRPEEIDKLEDTCEARKYYAVKIGSLEANSDTKAIAFVLYDKTSMSFEEAKAFLIGGYKEFAEVYASRPAAKDLVSALEKVGAYAVAQEVDADGKEVRETPSDWNVFLTKPVEPGNRNKVLKVISNYAKYEVPYEMPRMLMDSAYLSEPNRILLCHVPQIRANEAAALLESVGAEVVVTTEHALETISDIKYDIVLMEPVEERNVNKVLDVIRKELVTYKLLSAPTTLLYNLKYNSARIVAHMLANAGAKVKIAEKKSEAENIVYAGDYDIILGVPVYSPNIEAACKLLKKYSKVTNARALSLLSTPDQILIPHVPYKDALRIQNEFTDVRAEVDIIQTEPKTPVEQYNIFLKVPVAFTHLDSVKMVVKKYGKYSDAHILGILNEYGSVLVRDISLKQSAPVMEELKNAGAVVALEKVGVDTRCGWKVVLEEKVTKEKTKSVGGVLKELFKPVWKAYPTNWNKKGSILISFIPTIEEASDIRNSLRAAGAIVSVEKQGKE